MPAAAVEVTAKYKEVPPVKYAVTVNSGSADATTAAQGNKVTITADPAPTGKEFDKWEVVSPAGLTLADATKETTTFTMPANNVEVTAKYKETPAVTYTIIMGADGTWDGKSDYVIEVKRSIDDEHCFDRFNGAAIDGIDLKHGENMDLAIGSTIVIIKSDYLKTLSAGTHNVVVNFTDNSVTTTLTINAASTTTSGSNLPATGETVSPTFWIGCSCMAAGMLFAIVLIQKKRKIAQQ